uniref:Uncharacterized protein n=1 Tax=Arundo donax TaxID=35708 RepID=A0A0A9B7Y3_ARUDO
MRASKSQTQNRRI